MNFINPCFDTAGHDYPPPGGPAMPVQAGPAVIDVWMNGSPGHPYWLQAIIPPGAYQQGAAPTAAIRTQLKPFGLPGDDAGHIIAANLGGPGNQLWNFFPQSLNINRGVWAQQEQICANELRLGNQVRLCFRFYYGGQPPTRPESFEYCYKLANGATLTNDLVNP